MASFKSLSISLLFAIGSAQIIGDTPWDTLITTFPKFLPVPLNTSQAIAGGWELVIGCDSDDAPGNVYWYDKDLTSMPIFNADGNIAGIIIGIEDPGESQHGRAPWVKYEITYDNFTFYGIEGIFRDPDTICTVGSTGDVEFGDRLWFANGSHTAYNKIPLNQSYCALTYKQGWDQGGCKDGYFKMGVHYWRYNAVNLDCDNSYPIFILYDDNRLHAWGVAMGNTDRPYANSSRWEHPPGSLLTNFFLPGEAPTCLAEQSNLYNSIHIYMTSSVLNHTTPCPEIENITTTTIDCTGELYNGTDDKVQEWIIIVPIVIVVVLVLAAIVYWKKCRVSKESKHQQALLMEDGQYHSL